MDSVFDASSSSCELCSAGKYKDTISDTAYACRVQIFQTLQQVVLPLQTAAAFLAVLVLLSTCNLPAGCQAGTYENSGSCASCVQYQTSPANSASSSNCVCDIGYSGNGQNDPNACTACPAGTYKNTTGSDACTTCPAESSSLPGSDAITACKCNAGYTGPDGGLCAACQAGKFKAENGSGLCTACPGDFSSPQASVAVDACGCVDSYYTDSGADTCEECTNGLTFDDGLVLWWRFENSAHLNFDSITGENIGTSANAHSEQMAAKLGQSLSVDYGSPSYMHLGVDDINIRGQQHSMTFFAAVFSDQADDSVLVNFFPPHAWSLQAKKNAGIIHPHIVFQGVSGGGNDLLTDISKEFAHYAFILNNDNLDVYVNGVLRATRTLRQDNHYYRYSSSSDAPASEGILNIGRYYLGELGRSGGAKLDDFRIYNRALSEQEILVLSRQQTLPGEEQPCMCADNPQTFACFCDPGQFDDVATGSGCTACPVGKYDNSNGNATSCTLCPADTYSDSTGISSVSSCHACPANTESLPGSDDTGDCICKAGYTEDSGSGDCVACALNFYKAENGSAACTPCPNAAITASMGSTSLFDCVCKPGIAFKNKVNITDGCVGCSNTEYLEESSCKACPQNSVIIERNITGIEQCGCNAGYYNHLTASQQTCNACPPGQYNTEKNQTSCTLCPAGKFGNATAATTLLAGCEDCALGQYQDEEGRTNCKDCPAGTYLDSAPSAALSDCQKCPAGKYSAIAGIVSEEECEARVRRIIIRQRPDLTITRQIASNVQSNSHSSKGSQFTRVLLVQRRVQARCPWPERDSLSDDEFCKPCSPGFYNAEVNKTLCTPCPAGTASSEVAIDHISGLQSAPKNIFRSGTRRLHSMPRICRGTSSVDVRGKLSV